MRRTKIIMIAAGCMLCSLSIMAANVNITVSDNASPPGQSPYGWSGGPTGVAGEDNETESANGTSTYQGQVWDLEALVVAPRDVSDPLSHTTLYMVGGYNFEKAGTAGFKPGDLFIKIGGSLPGNTLSGYDYAIQLSDISLGVAKIIQLNGTSVLNPVENPQLLSNPWNYKSGGTVIGQTTLSYNQAADYSAVASAPGISSLKGDGTAPSYNGSFDAPLLYPGTALSEVRNVLAIDMNWLSVPAGEFVGFSYTYECGNDSIKGEYTGGFTRVPDGGASIILLGICMTSLGLFGRKQLKA